MLETKLQTELMTAFALRCVSKYHEQIIVPSSTQLPGVKRSKGVLEVRSEPTTHDLGNKRFNATGQVHKLKSLIFCNYHARLQRT